MHDKYYQYSVPSCQAVCTSFNILSNAVSRHHQTCPKPSHNKSCEGEQEENPQWLLHLKGLIRKLTTVFLTCAPVLGNVKHDLRTQLSANNRSVPFPIPPL